VIKLSTAQPAKKSPAGKTAKIISVISIPSRDPERLGEMDTMITYQVDPLHTYSVIIPSAHPTESEIMAAVRADYAQRSKISNMEIPLRR